ARDAALGARGRYTLHGHPAPHSGRRGRDLTLLMTGPADGMAVLNYGYRRRKVMKSSSGLLAAVLCLVTVPVLAQTTTQPSTTPTLSDLAKRAQEKKGTPPATKTFTNDDLKNAGMSPADETSRPADAKSDDAKDAKSADGKGAKSGDASKADDAKKDD